MKQKPTRKLDKMREHIMDIAGIGYFIIGLVAVLKEGFTLFNLAWLIIGSLWVGVIALDRITERKLDYVAYALYFSLFFLACYTFGAVLRTYEFRPVGLLYWYLAGVVAGGVIYFMHKKIKK